MTFAPASVRCCHTNTSVMRCRRRGSFFLDTLALVVVLVPMEVSMPYINVYVSPVLNEAISKAAFGGGREWSRSKWLRRLAQRELKAEAPRALLAVIKDVKKGARK